MLSYYKYEELNVGHRESFTAQITEEMMDGFRAITGDLNPLHASSEFAKGKGFPGKVAFGMLTASFLSTLAGVYIPGENSLIQSVDIKFAKPVFPGDTLLVEGEVAEKNDTFKVLKLKVQIRNQKGEKVLRGSMYVRCIE